MATLSARCQAAWSPAGLYLAVSVHDTTFRAAPAGVNLFKGDSVEILFDADLAGDFNTAAADGDDFQFGIGPNADMTQLNGYRWMPSEGAFPFQGAVRNNGAGYDLEVLIPWAALGVNSGAVKPNTTFGFTVSVNDNDAPQPLQQAVLSSSPARSTYDQPGQWGTLVLTP